LEVLRTFAINYSQGEDIKREKEKKRGKKKQEKRRKEKKTKKEKRKMPTRYTV